MDQSCAGSDKRSLFMERYPEIFFLLSYTPFQPFQSNVTQAEVERCCAELHLSGVDVLYVVGVERGYSYAALKPWLKEKRERLLIYLEDDLGAIDALEHAEELLADPQVHLQFLQDPKALHPTLEQLVETYPAHRIEVIAFQKPRQLLKRVRLKLMRQTAVTNALMTEALYSHRLVENVLANLKRWPQSFFANKLKGKFQGIPAVICGAGPSLGSAIPLLQSLEDRALIIAGGSTITALSNRGIVPHLGLALDPNPEEYDRLRVMSAYEMPFLYGTRVQPDVFNTCNGPRGYLHSFTGGPCEAYFERQLDMTADPVGPDLGSEAFSVTTLAIALAVEMGCNPIILSGVDLAYTGMQRYAEGVMPSSDVFFQELQKETRASERLLKRKGIRGSMVYTLVKWVMESSSIASYAKAHKQAQFINVSPSGLGFKGIPNCSFEDIIDTHCQKSLDLRAMVHHEIERSRFREISKEAIAEQMKSVSLSLEKLLEICNQMLEEFKDFSADKPFPTGKMTVLQLDFEEEKAFECFFPHVGPAIDRLLNRSYAIRTGDDPEMIGTQSVARLTKKWEHLKTMIEQELKTLSTLI